MKILYVYNRPRGNGGATNATLDTIRSAEEYGLEIKVFARDSGTLAPNLLGRLRAGVNTFYARDGVRDFVATLDSFKPDIVHVYELFPLVSPWILPHCTRRGIPVVMNCDDYHLTCPLRNHYRDGKVCTECLDTGEHKAVLHNCRGNLVESATVAAYSAMVRRMGIFSKHVSHYIALSDFSRQWLTERGGVDRDCISVVPPLFKLPEVMADPGKGEYVAYAGRFVPEKGIHTFLSAVQQCQAPCSLSRNSGFLVSIPLPDNVQVVVTSDAQELQEFYLRARIVVVPSLWFETFGLVPAEAMALGIPVILSRIGALTGLVDEGIDGLYFEPGNASDLAEKITLLWNNPDLCRRLGQAAREKAQRLWRPERFFERLLSVYAQVCRDHRQTAEDSLTTEIQTELNP